MEKRLLSIAESLIKEEKRGLYTLTWVLRGAWEFAQAVHEGLVDLEKAFDHVPPGVLWGSTPGVCGTGPVTTDCPVPIQTARKFGPVVSRIRFQ